MQESSLVSMSGAAFIVCTFFDDGLSDDGHQCEVMLHCSFDLYFSNSDIEHLFLCLLAICIYSLEKCLFRSSAIFDWIIFWCWVVWVAYIFWRLILCQLLHLQIFFHVLRVAFHLVDSYILGYWCLWLQHISLWGGHNLVHNIHYRSFFLNSCMIFPHNITCFTVSLLVCILLLQARLW